jgi:hypothetical protein
MGVKSDRSVGSVGQRNAPGGGWGGWPIIRPMDIQHVVVTRFSMAVPDEWKRKAYGAEENRPTVARHFGKAGLYDFE